MRSETLRSHLLFLESRDYRVVTATNGQDGLALLESEGFDAVLLDHRMAGKDGLDVLEEIKERHPFLPVIMVTQSHEEELAEEAFRHRVDGFLVKPVHAVQVAPYTQTHSGPKAVGGRSGCPASTWEDHRQIQSLLADDPDWRKWIQIYERLTAWNLRIDELEETGLVVAYRDLYRECNRAFAGLRDPALSRVGPGETTRRRSQ
ncbi:MAG: hypothetical protein KatS3mg115_2066 [Candidatus Poribacteria bacterium]|nr:MAG: hypothetical protein KatS3mg115_2066 [Candidatus Poribacteria bacterium]